MGRPKKVVEEEPKKKVKKKVEEEPKKKLVKVPKKIKNPRDNVTRSQAIKIFCIECMGYQKSLVKDCPDFGCPLWAYRKGYGQETTDVPMRSGDKK